MLNAQFFFLSDEYYIDFPDDKLMKNKDVINGQVHSRPCFFAFSDYNNPYIYWIVPISSQYEKYQKIANEKLKKYGYCDTICFGKVLGRKTAFLIQNMCPATKKYLTPYIDKSNNPIRINEKESKNIIKKVKKVLRATKHGKKVVFPDILKIYDNLDNQTKLNDKK